MSVEYIQFIDPLKAIENASNKTVEELTIKVQNSYKAGCPVDTGTLRSSIYRDFQGDKKNRTGFVGSNIEYAIYVEFGTRNQSAQPALRSAISEHVSGNKYIESYKAIAERDLSDKEIKRFNI